MNPHLQPSKEVSPQGNIQMMLGKEQGVLEKQKQLSTLTWKS